MRVPGPSRIQRASKIKTKACAHAPAADRLKATAKDRVVYAGQLSKATRSIDFC
jgi:hypothetical protein